MGSIMSTAGRNEASSSVDEKIVENVDLDDVVKHESLADDWWDEKNGNMRGLHLMNDVRVPFVRDGLVRTGVLKKTDIKNPHYLSGIKIIEVGCGVGVMTESLAKLGADVTGVDPSEVLTGVARQHAADNAHTLKAIPNYVCSNIEDYAPNNKEKFDVLVLSEVIEHVVGKEQFLKSSLLTLKPGGSVIVTTPNRTFMSWVFNILVAENVLAFVPKGLHNWYYFIYHDDLKEMLNKLGCKTELIEGMRYNVFANKWELPYSTRFHYALHAVKIR